MLIHSIYLMKAAVILTAFNRREKTLACLERLFAIPAENVEFTVYLTDDGSTDGTSEAVAERFPQVVISHGDGSLYWAGGTDLSWRRAVADGGFDGYLWLNDDTVVKDNMWPEILAADKYSHEKYGMGGIYVGSTLDNEGKRRTYGGSRCLHEWRSGYAPVIPDGTYLECDIANGNVTFICSNVVDKLGCMYPGYIHGGDYDYTYWAHTEGFPLIVMKDYVGFCDNDHKSLREILVSLPLRKRIEYLYSPNGMQLPTAILFQKRFYPYFVPVTYISYWIKALFPWILKK